MKIANLYILTSLMTILSFGCGSQTASTSKSNSTNTFDRAESPIQAHQQMGPSISGGGDAVVCYDNRGEIKSAELFDLYEGKKLYHYNYDQERAKKLSLREWIEIFSDRLNKVAYSNALISEMEVIYSNLNTGRNFIRNAKIQEINDEANVIGPPSGCKLVQLARYLSASKVIVQQELWEHLDPFDQAALIMHETFYSTDKILSSTPDSRYARYLTSTFVEEENSNIIGVDLNVIPPVLCIGSTMPIESEESIINTQLFGRSSLDQSKKGETLFYMQKIKGRDLGGTYGPSNPDTDFIEVRFISLNGRLILKQTPAYIDGHTWQDLEEVMSNNHYLNASGIIFSDLGFFRVFFRPASFGDINYGTLEFTTNNVTSEFPLVTKDNKIHYKCISTQ